MTLFLLAGCTQKSEDIIGQACTDSGGLVATAMCCSSASDYPNTCLIGACGCSPDNSHAVKTCVCGEGQCFDGVACVAVQNPVNPADQACTEAGGTVSTANCCLSAGDYPNTCLIGACGCSPENSQEVKTCYCGEGMCYNGSACISMEIVEESCTAPTGESMTVDEARDIAQASNCTLNATLSDTYFCNENTGTWWFDLNLEKEGCSPACVVDVVTQQAEINWRCTGLIVP